MSLCTGNSWLKRGVWLMKKLPVCLSWDWKERKKQDKFFQGFLVEEMFNLINFVLRSLFAWSISSGICSFPNAVSLKWNNLFFSSLSLVLSLRLYCMFRTINLSLWQTYFYTFSNIKIERQVRFCSLHPI